MAIQEARDHHYAPQFFLRNFAVDKERNYVTTVQKHDSRAVWRRRAIKQIGYERDFYVHTTAGIPVSVETRINRDVETPLSQSDTWTKITAGRTDALDRSDKPVLYSLIRHLEARTPHFESTMTELARMAADPTSEIPFTVEEREYFALVRAHDNTGKQLVQAMAATLAWTESAYKGAALAVFRSPIPLRSSTTPVLAISAPAHPAITLPLPGMVPSTLALTLNPTTIACLTLGDFDNAFHNNEIDQQTALGFNRHFLAQFAHFPKVRHLITDRENLGNEMAWAHYELIMDKPLTMVFQRGGSV